MSRVKALIVSLAVAGALVTAPTALAHTSSIGSPTGAATMNLCPASIACTYVNFRHGKPSDVVKHSGTLTDYSMNAGSVGGQVQLRVLRPAGHGKFKVVRSSGLEEVASPGLNTFATSLKVKAGDVLALSNDTSGIYMASAPTGTCVRYIQGLLPDGATARPDHIVPQLHLLLGADVKH
jgi:hypothetical protein